MSTPRSKPGKPTLSDHEWAKNIWTCCDNLPAMAGNNSAETYADVWLLRTTGLVASLRQAAEQSGYVCGLRAAAEFVHENLMYEEGSDFDLPERILALAPPLSQGMKTKKHEPTT